MAGLSQYTNPSHIARATLEANAFQTREVIESMLLDTNTDVAAHPHQSPNSPPLPTAIAQPGEDSLRNPMEAAVSNGTANGAANAGDESLAGSGHDRVAFTRLKVDGGVTAGKLAMQVLADTCGFAVERPSMLESTALGSALLAGAGIQPPLFGWDLEKPETLSKVGAGGATVFEPKMKEEERDEAWRSWKRAVERSMGWDEAPDET